MSAFALVVTAWLAAAPADPPAPVGPSALPVRRVVLYGNGVAFVERRGRVKGRAEVRLPVKPSQVDDVLKSLVVLDLGHGRVGAVGYDTPAPAETGLGEVPFRLAAATSGDRGTGGLAEVLRQLQGAEVAAATAEGSLVGRVLTVETRRTEEKDGRAVASTHLVLAGEGGALASVDLARVRSVRVLDGDARRDLGVFARATAAARRHDATTIVVSSEGKGARELVVATRSRLRSGRRRTAPSWTRPASRSCRAGRSSTTPAATTGTASVCPSSPGARCPSSSTSSSRSSATGPSCRCRTACVPTRNSSAWSALSTSRRRRRESTSASRAGLPAASRAAYPAGSSAGWSEVYRARRRPESPPRR